MIPRDRKPTSNAPSMDNTEELESEARDLPHDLKPSAAPWSPPTLSAMKAHPNFGRRESLLTRQLHSETEHTDDEVAASDARTSRTHSTWSNPSVASTAELTSDDGHSVASPSVSPPFPAANVPQALPLHVKPLDQPVKIVGQEDANNNNNNVASNGEKTVEAGLGRKRCITFACRGKQEAAPERPTASDPQQTTTASSEPAPPQQKKCSLKFVCPSRPTTEKKPSEQAPPKRLSSPAPPVRQASANAKAQAGKVHRGSDSTVTHGSPKSVRRLPPSEITTTQPVKIAQPDKSLQRRRYSTDPDESDEGEEAVRFHEFGTSDEEPEDWVQESTCHRSRLTVSDTLKKENVIRKACEEVEEEAVEEDEEAEKELDEGLEDDLDDDDDEDGGDDLDDEDDEDEDDEESDDGFHSDDEEGFANSDEEDENDSDLEWWRPGGVSTAATSVEHLDRLAIVNSQDPKASSSIGSASSGRVSPHHRSRPRRSRKSDNNSSAALPIDRERDVSPGLPDSTDFVCGTLDEDRPLEQAYLNRRKIREAAKRQPRPQDIDPSFPTSDPEMDEEDDEDLIDPTESEHDGLFHGALDEMHGKGGAGMGMERKPSTRGRHRSNSHRSPPTATATAAGTGAAGTTMSTVRYHSPAPPKKKCLARSPAPPRLFNRSPNRMRSPAPLRRVHSPPPSPTDQNNHPFSTAPHLAQRNAPPTRTASLPRRGVGFASTTRSNKTSSSRNTSHRDASSSNYNNNSSSNYNTTDDPDREASSAFPSDSDDTTVVSTSHNHKNRRNAPTNKDAPTRRAAIDIVKGLDKKRQFRKEKLYQKKCAAAAAAAAEKADKSAATEKGNAAAGGEKIKPGRGAERMRAIGLQLQNYHGKAEHILSL